MPTTKARGITFSDGHTDLTAEGADVELELGERTTQRGLTAGWRDGSIRKTTLVLSSGKHLPKQSQKTRPVRWFLGKETCQVSMGPGGQSLKPTCTGQATCKHAHTHPHTPAMDPDRRWPLPRNLKSLQAPRQSASVTLKPIRARL